MPISTKNRLIYETGILDKKVKLGSPKIILNSVYGSKYMTKTGYKNFEVLLVKWYAPKNGKVDMKVSEHFISRQL